MTDVVPRSVVWGGVPALPFGASVDGLEMKRSAASDVGLVSAQSFQPWKPHLSAKEKVKCGHPTKKGEPCQMYRAYDPDTGVLTPLCKSHWSTVFSLVNHALIGAAQQAGLVAVNEKENK